MYRFLPGKLRGGPLQTLFQLSAVIDRFTELFGKLANLLVTILIVIGFSNVIFRYAGRFVGRRLTSNAIIETQWYLFAILFLVGFAYILKHNVNVRVDFLYAKWGVRRKALVDLLGTLFLVIPFCILGIYVSIGPVLASWGRLPDGSWGMWEISPD